MNQYDEDDDYLTLSFLFSLYVKENRKFLSKRLDKLGIQSVTLLPILFDCYHQKEVRQKGLRSRLNRENALLTRQLRQLENDGLISRIEDDENRRENIIRLTQKGEEITKKLLEFKSEREDKLFKNSDISVTQLRKVIIDLIEESNKLNTDEH